MTKRILLSGLLGAAAALFAIVGAAYAQAGPPAGSGTYQDLVALYDDYLDWKANPPDVGELNYTESWGGVQDYGAKAVRDRKRKIRGFLKDLENMNVAAWPRAQQSEYLAVRSKMQEENFLLNISKPWQRDPGYYVDQMLFVTFVDLPVAGDELAVTREQLKAIPVLVSEAKKNLTDVAADYLKLALHNLRNADGVGHGHPYREVPPAGVIGWYDDLLERVAADQPGLRAEVEAARVAVVEFERWLNANSGKMTGKAGVGKEALDWYIKNVKLMPYTSDEIVVLGQREIDRLWALYGLEVHRNRKLPELEPAQSEEEYVALVEETDRQIREYLVNEEIITIPDYIGYLRPNVPWIVRPQGRNFWEEIQYRNPSPDHFHAVIPGHRFDGVVEDNNDHPIRGRFTDGVRSEGWAMYLEEGMLHTGFYADEDMPRVRELIYIFGIFRAARVPADVWLQRNEMTVAEVVDYWRELTPYLDPDVARVDAEIYLRRPPGYGLGYTMGLLQMQRLLADARRLQGDAFTLKDFHDEFMGLGRLPLSLIRWEMTGLDDEISAFWETEPLPKPIR